MQFVLKNANVVNVFTEEILPADVLIEDGIISGVGSYCGFTEVDCTGKYICPGFIDAHVHIESAMVSPLEFCKNIVPWGTTAVIADPHEIVNVAGVKAVEYMLSATQHSPVDVYFMMPSSVPATAFETNGSDFLANDMAPYADHPRVLGLGEVMCFPDVLAGKPHIKEKIELFSHKMIDGHCPGLSGTQLQAYCKAGIQTDHECVSFEEALEKIRCGMKILVREGSGAKNTQAIVEGMVGAKASSENFLFCTDDKHISHIKETGNILCNVKKAVACGLDPVKAIKMASYQAAVTYGLKQMGAVAAGYQADIVVFDDLKTLAIHRVYKKGMVVDAAFLASFDRFSQDGRYADALRNSVRFKEITPSQIQVKRKEENAVIENVPYQLLTRRLMERLPGEGDRFIPQGDYCKVCVVERHRNTGNVAAAPVKHFGIRKGAIASTVAHDSHNVIAVGDNDRDICLAVNELKKMGGGYVVVQDGTVAGSLPLVIGGLMSEQPADAVIAKIEQLVQLVHEMGVPKEIEPFITLSFMALPVIPEIRLTDKGLFNVSLFQMEHQ